MEARILALAEVGVLSTPLTPLSYWSVAPESLATLSDLEICLLAYISSDLPPPPLEKSNDEYGAWLKELIIRACKLRAEIREACAK